MRHVRLYFSMSLRTDRKMLRSKDDVFKRFGSEEQIGPSIDLVIDEDEDYKVRDSRWRCSVIALQDMSCFKSSTFSGLHNHLAGADTPALGLHPKETIMLGPDIRKAVIPSHRHS